MTSAEDWELEILWGDCDASDRIEFIHNIQRDAFNDAVKRVRGKMNNSASELLLGNNEIPS